MLQILKPWIKNQKKQTKYQNICLIPLMISHFFMPKKEKEEFYLLKIVEIVNDIYLSTLANYNIKIEIDIDEK